MCPNLSIGLPTDQYDIYSQGLENAKTKYAAFYQNFRDHGFKHALEVTKYALKLGQDLGLQAEEMTLVAYASLSHDFGMQGGYAHVSGKIESSITKAIEKAKEMEDWLHDKDTD